MTELKKKAREAPDQPGCYLFKNEKGDVLYVGKAKKLKTRLLQYFGHDNRIQIPYLINDAVDIDYIVVSSELESLFLENTLIKQYMPPYNIMLKDDKNFAFIQIDYSKEIPQITYARTLEGSANTAKYFGPYSSVQKINKTLDAIRRTFTFCANSKISNRPCFYYYLHRCPGVCVGKISLEEYKVHINRIITFLMGGTSIVKQELKKSMLNASNRKNFEVAARLRDQLHAIEILEEKQLVQFAKKVTWDFVSIFSEGTVICFNIFKIREGKLTDKESFVFTNPVADNQASRTLQSFLEFYYAQTSDIPKEIYTEIKTEDPTIITNLLSFRSNKKTILTIPTRGDKLKLINLGKLNAQQYLHKWQKDNVQYHDLLRGALTELQTILHLPTYPRRIEGYDISNIQGTNPVGSMVVSVDGIATKSEYKKFKIQIKNTPDDFSMMREMLSRRLKHLEEKGERRKEKAIPAWPTPDLIMIDGGKGQLGVAFEEIQKAGLRIPVIGLAKRIEEIFLPNNPVPIILPHSSPVLHILQRLRDEAHRFAITFHRDLRSKQSTKSGLDIITGIGPVTKKLLKQKFGTVANVKKASLEELSDVIGKDKAYKIKRLLI